MLSAVKSLKGSQMKNLSAGIDFGTTNSVAGLSNDGDVSLIALEQKHIDIPTAIFFSKSKNNKKILFGRQAVTNYLNNDDEENRLMRSLKRVLGTPLMKSGTTVYGQSMMFKDIINLFMVHIKNKIDMAAAADVENIVMGRPVHFRDGDPLGDAAAQNELGQIAKSAGFKNVLFQYEPVAAAFAHEANLQSETLAAVIDIGGGTSDFTILRLGGANRNRADRTDDILANSGVRIGGNDFDKQLALDSFMPEFGMGTTHRGAHGKILNVPNTHYFDLSEWSKINSLYTYKNINMVRGILIESLAPEKYGRLLEIITHGFGHNILGRVEDAKINLTERDKVETVLSFMTDAPRIITTRDKFEKSIASATEKVRKTAAECAAMAGVNPTDVQLIILTGGSTEIPYVCETLCGVFPNAKVSGDNKLSSVGMGLAFDASRRFL